MNNFTMNCYEMKRKSVNFSKIMSKGLTKPDKKFISDMIYGINGSKDIKISNIARTLHEEIKLDNTIERLCIHLETFKEKEQVNNNYYNFVRKMINEYPIAIFDDSDITKIYGKKFEDIDMVKDGSDESKKYKPGYHMCNAVVLTSKKKQPIPIYSKVYSSKSKDFESSNKETYKSIDEVRKSLNRKSLMVFDRGYDDEKLFNYVEEGEDDILVRLKKNRSFLFKGKSKKLENVYDSRKGKIKMNVTFENKNMNVYISYTKATLPSNKKEYTLIFVYGLSNKEKFILLTNKKIKESKEAIKLVRIYLDRWRIETYHKAIKSEYHYEDMRIRKLKSINNLTNIFNMVIGLVISLIEEMDSLLLSIKILYESKSLRKNVGVWITQFAVGIHKILSRSQSGIKSYFNKSRKQLDNERHVYQLSLNL